MTGHIYIAGTRSRVGHIQPPITIPYTTQVSFTHFLLKKLGVKDGN